jgi:RimJ/RimL family protein N-acetyltransferase
LEKNTGAGALPLQRFQSFFNYLKTRPLYARAAKDNSASIRVLEKCGFTISGEDKGFSNARGEDVEEFILKLGIDNKQ